MTDEPPEKLPQVRKDKPMPSDRTFYTGALLFVMLVSGIIWRMMP